jgi:hypothetical protein
MRLEEAKKHLHEIEQMMATADELRAMFPDPPDQATMPEEVWWYLANVDKYLSGEADTLGEVPWPSLLHSYPAAAPRRRRAR